MIVMAVCIIPGWLLEADKVSILVNKINHLSSNVGGEGCSGLSFIFLYYMVVSY